MITFIKRAMGFFAALITVISAFLGISDGLNSGKVDNFRVTTYIRGDAIMYWGGEVNAEDFDIVTDAIIFECATFNNKGQVEYDTEKLETVLTKVRTAIGDRDIHLTLNLI